MNNSVNNNVNNKAKNRTDRRSVLLGLFTMGAIGVLAAGVLMIGSLNDSFTRRIIVSATFEQVNGLKKGDNIWFSGVKVGVVKAVEFDVAALVRVDLRIDQAAAVHIRQDVLATIGSDGLIGNRIVILKGGTATAPTLSEGDTLSIGEDFSTEDVVKMLKDNNTNLLAITTDLKGITGDLRAGKGSAGRLLQDEGLYTALTASVVSLGETADSARALTGSLGAFSRELNREGNLPRALVTDQELYPKLQGTVDHLERTSQRALVLMDGLAEGVEDPRTPSGAQSRDQAAGADLKGTLANMERASATLDEDLVGLQHSLFLRGYFRRKARADARAEARADAR
jgi:phospholipid/cholesterol/gamma-HCH transport system substrate-binding protein